MAKREYVDIGRVLDEIKCMDNGGIITRSTNHICEDIRTISTFTEQEIVKPYLDKLRAEVEERLSMIMFDDYGNETPDHAEFISILDEILK